MTVRLRISSKDLKRMLGAAALLALIPACFSQIRTDYGIYPEPPLPALPAGGGKMIDPVFGTTIMRLTDANDGSDCQVGYSYWPQFNLGNTYVQAQCFVNGRMETKIWSFDPVSFTRGASFVMNVATASGWPISPSDLMWSGVDPNVMFGHPMNAQTINATNVTTGTNTTLVDLASQIPSGGAIDQMLKSIDDNVFAFNVNDSSGSRYGYIVWSHSTNSVLLNQYDTNVDEVELDKTGRYLIVIHTDGSDRIWDLSTGSVTDLGWNSTDQGFFHRDTGHGTMLFGSWPNGVGYRSLSNPLPVTNLLNFPSSGQTPHFSMLADNEGWGMVSRYSDIGATATAAFENEIFQVATDGSGRVRRFVHHGSVYHEYADSPRANISRDGAYVAFVSNWGNATGRRDVFLVQITSPTVATVPTASLSSNTTSLTQGQSATLSWSTTGASSVSITPSVGTVAASGSVSVSPTSSTTYTLTAANSAGSTTKSVTISVAAPLPTATLTASTTSITSGQSATLSWSTSGGSSVSISPSVGVVAASGSVNVSPTATTTYTLTATNSTGSTTKSVTISVAAPLPTATLTASTTSITSGQSASLSWSTTGATSVSVSPDIGVTTLSGTAAVTPTASTTYTLSATNSTGTTTRSVTISVTTSSSSTTSTSSSTSTPFGAYLEAEAATITAPMVIGTDAAASGQKYVVTTAPESGTAVFSVAVPSAGTYIIWGRVLCLDGDSDSFYVSVDGGPEDIYDAAENTWSTAWQWTMVNGRNGGLPLTLNPRTFVLSAGTHTIQFRGREIGAKLDEIFVTNNLSAVPSAPAVVAGQYLEAEKGTIVSPMVVASDPLASGGQYVYTPKENKGTVTFNFSVATAGQYYAWARVIAPDGNTDSFYVSIDGGSEDIYDAAQFMWSPAWQWNQVNGRNSGNPRVFTLAAGSHRLTFRGREQNTKLDRIFIAPNSSLQP